MFLDVVQFEISDHLWNQNRENSLRLLAPLLFLPFLILMVGNNFSSKLYVNQIRRHVDDLLSRMIHKVSRTLCNMSILCISVHCYTCNLIFIKSELKQTTITKDIFLFKNWTRNFTCRISHHDNSWSLSLSLPSGTWNISLFSYCQNVWHVNQEETSDTLSILFQQLQHYN